MTNKEIQEAIKLVPTFIKMCENDLGEGNHKVKTPLTYEEYQKVQKLIGKLKSLDNYVNSDIFI